MTRTARCQYIAGHVDREVARDSERHDSLYCGKPVAHILLPYCREHAQRCFLKETKAPACKSKPAR